MMLLRALELITEASAHTIKDVSYTEYVICLIKEENND